MSDCIFMNFKMEILVVKSPDKDWKKSQKPPENQTQKQKTSTPIQIKI